MKATSRTAFPKTSARWIFSFVGAIALVIASTASADRGGWVASGGELFRDGKNPWWVKNTTSVDYCIEFDSATISTDLASTKTAILDAIAYWKSEFGVTDLKKIPTLGNGFANVATQTFNEVTKCGADTPLQFRIGYGSLTKEEIEFLDNPIRFVGVSVRKEYDTKSMAGKGIVYIASDMGTNAYDTSAGGKAFFPKAWSEQRLLTYALIHEMGHVFGIPHMGTGVMSEVFLEQLLNKGFVDFYRTNAIQTFLTPPMNFEVCSLAGSFDATFFLLPATTACIRIEGKIQDGSFDWQVYSRESGAKEAPAGTIRGAKLNDLALSMKPAVIVQLPDQQTVFDLIERQGNPFMIGPVFAEGAAKGVFKGTVGHRTYDVQVELRADSIVVTGLVGGKMKPVLVYSPPSLLYKIFPVAP